jgi:hypothetical protein
VGGDAPGEGTGCQAGSGIYGGRCVSVLCGRLNEPPVLISLMSQHQRTIKFRSLEKQIRIKRSGGYQGGSSPLFQKPLKACDFHGRTSKEPTIFWS